MAGRLHELARAAPDDRRAAAELLAVRVAEEVVVHARAEVVRALDPLQDVPEEDEVDAVVRVEAERRDVGDVQARVLELALEAGGPVADSAFRAAVVGVLVAARPAEAELQVELVLDRPELGLRGHAVLADAGRVVGVRAQARRAYPI